MKSRQFHGIFCDDVRLEISGKYSLIGCYGPDLGVPEFPFFLPKLSFSFNLCLPNGERPESVRISIKKDGEDTFNMAFDIDHQEATNAPKSAFTLNGGFDMVGITFEKECLLEAVAHVDGEAVPGATLRVHLNEQPPAHH